MSNMKLEILEEHKLKAGANVAAAKSLIEGGNLSAAVCALDTFLDHLASIAEIAEQGVSGVSEADRLSRKLSEAVLSKQAASAQASSLERELHQVSNQVGALESKLNEATAQLELASTRIAEQDAELESLRPTAANAVLMDKELRALRKLNPTKLVAENESLINKHNKALNRKGRQIEAQQTRISELSAQLAKKKKDEELTSGMTLINKHPGQTGEADYSLTLYRSPRKFRLTDDNAMPLMGDLPWSLLLSCSNGVSVDVAFTIYGSPVYPSCDEIALDFPRDMNSLIHKEFLKLIGKSSDGLSKVTLELIRQFKQVPATTLEVITDEEKAALQKAKLIDAFDCVSMTSRTFAYTLEKSAKYDLESGLALHKKLVEFAVSYKKDFFSELRALSDEMKVA